MQKSTVLITIIALILLGSGLAYYGYNRGKADDLIEQQVLGENNNNSESQAVVQETQNTEVFQENVSPDASMIAAPESAIFYTITEGTVNYVADKLWLKKPQEKIIGTSGEISGNGWFDETSSTGQVEVNLSFDTLKSPSPARDSDLANNYVKTKEIKFIADINDPPIKLGQNFSSKVNSKLTINGITKDVVFDVTGNISQDSLTASGSSKINITDFNIKTPSLLEVYTVGEEVELKFDIRGMVKP